MTVGIRKIRIIVLDSNRIEYWRNYYIRFEISNIRTALLFYDTYWLSVPPKLAAWL